MSKDEVKKALDLQKEFDLARRSVNWQKHQAEARGKCKTSYHRDPRTEIY